MDNDPNKYYQKLKAKLYNTIERLKAYNTINSYFSGMTFAMPDNLEELCHFEKGQ